jgi:SAM-dependent methyltransferase
MSAFRCCAICYYRKQSLRRPLLNFRWIWLSKYFIERVLIFTAPPAPNQPLEGSATLIPPLMATAEGIVLELGPGSGVQVKYFKPATKIKKIYGAEPCKPLHKTLTTNAYEAGLGDKYDIVTAGAEKETLIPGLAKAGLLAQPGDGGGIFDTIVCVRVLCSVKDLRETSETIYKLLKPGGKLLICEHVVNPWWQSKGSYIARTLQSIYTFLGWTFLVGNCHLTRNTGQALIDAVKPLGGWDEVDLSTSFTWSCLPYTSGTLTKRQSP